MTFSTAAQFQESSRSIVWEAPFKSRVPSWRFVTIFFLVTALCNFPTTASVLQDTQIAEVANYVTGVSALAKFSVALYQAIGAHVGPLENIVISPLSVATVLSMAGVGAKGNTSLQLKKALGLTNFDTEKISKILGSLVQSMIKVDGNYTLEAANQLYVADKFRLTNKFQVTLKESYGASAQSVNFATDASQTYINKWVENLTHQKIKELLPPGSVNIMTNFVLLNAIYFKGNWLRKFDSSLTKVESFYLASKYEIIDVDMMHMDALFRTGYIESVDARMLELPYAGGKLSMFILLPNRIEGLPKLESKMNQGFLEEAIGNLDEAEMHIAIPKFKLEVNIKLKEILISMGMADLFDEGLADFSGISEKDGLYISDIFHTSLIDVNEEGSEAAAATGKMAKSSFGTPPESPPFFADHPFYYYIRDNEKRFIIFSGRLVQPNVKL